MRKIGGLIAVAAVAALLTGCGGLLGAQTRAYLDSIPVRDLSSLSGFQVAGTHAGSYTIAMPPGGMAMYRTVKVNVTVDIPGHVQSITVTSPTRLDNADFGQKIGGEVVAQQSLAVDSISGASYSSKSFLKAVENALE
jgi:uncharacterized protein with FMN-binding domain